jgi:ABC-2 type transport system ATP-binding protein
MSSHVLSEVARVCDRVALLRKGELALLADFEEIRRLAARRVRVLFSSEVQPLAQYPPEYEILELKPQAWSLRAEGPLGPLLKLVTTLPVKDIEVQEPRLEDVLIKYYRES